MTQVPIEWNDELGAVDYMFFRADMDSRNRTTVMQIDFLDVVPDVERLVSHLETVTRLIPRMRQRVVAPMVPVVPARWVVDPDFDLRHHLRRMSLPGAPGMREVLDWAADWAGDPIDPNRPLWTIALIEDLSGDPEVKAALVWKLSHAFADGMAGVVLDNVMRSDVRDPEPVGPVPLPIPEDVSALDLTKSGLRRVPLTLTRMTISTLGEAAGLGLRAVRDPATTFKETRNLVGAVHRTVNSGLEGSPLLRRRGLRRRFDYFECRFADLRAAAKAANSSVNDAYFAVIGGAMRHYHESLGVPIDTISVGMPINARGSGDDSGGNRIAAAMIALPVAERDPVERMHTIHDLVITGRSDAAFNPAELVAPMVNWLPSSMMGSQSQGSFIDIQASNVPGHPGERFFAGTRIVRSAPYGPLPGVAMMVTMKSGAGQLNFGINYDPDSFTHEELLRESWEVGLEEVLAVGRRAAAAGEVPPPERRTTADTPATLTSEADRQTPGRSAASRALATGPARQGAAKAPKKTAKRTAKKAVKKTAKKAVKKTATTAKKTPTRSGAKATAQRRTGSTPGKEA